MENKKIFIAGAIQLESLEPEVIKKLNNLIKMNAEILVGDACGIDKAVQKFLCDKKYMNVKIYATNGKARNNIGNWEVVGVKSYLEKKSREFFTVKDIEMTKKADMGFMIWNAKSQGTLTNMINLLKANKQVVIFLQSENKLYNLKSLQGLNDLIINLDSEVQTLYKKLIKKFVTDEKNYIQESTNNQMKLI